MSAVLATAPTRQPTMMRPTHKPSHAADGSRAIWTGLGAPARTGVKADPQAGEPGPLTAFIPSAAEPGCAPQLAGLNCARTSGCMLAATGSGRPAVRRSLNTPLSSGTRPQTASSQKTTPLISQPPVPG